jgi:hypothetical protein
LADPHPQPRRQRVAPHLRRRPLRRRLDEAQERRVLQQAEGVDAGRSRHRQGSR